MSLVRVIRVIMLVFVNNGGLGGKGGQGVLCVSCPNKKKNNIKSFLLKIYGTLNVTELNVFIITLYVGLLHYFACQQPRWSFRSWNRRGVLPCCSFSRQPLFLEIHCLPTASIMLLGVWILQA